MLNPAHILEVALLLLVAFLVGVTVGSIARALLLRLRPAKTSTTVATVSAPGVAVAPEPALVAAPTIDPVVKPVAPTAPADVPAPDFAEAVQAIAASKPEAFTSMSEIRMPTLAPLPALDAKKSKSEMAPARAAGQTTSGQLVASPIKSDEAPPASLESGEGAQVIPFPLERAASAAEERIAAETSVVEAATTTVEPTALPDIVNAEAAEVIASETAPVEAMEVDPAEAPTESPEPVTEVVVEATVSEPELAPEQTPIKVKSATKSSEDDEVAAMRAIEGNWSPKRGASGRSRATSIPEGVDAESAVAAAGAAVKAATDAAAAVVADQPEEAPGKPDGIEGPRHGVKDNLTNVIGILPIIETALNKIGVYHFDQIAEFSDENVAWLEGHLGIAGRVGREHWREQARELAVVSERARKVAGQQ